MKKDLATIIIAAVAGFVIAFFVTNMLMPGLENFSFKNLGTSVNATVTAPSDEVFNFRAVNPTVEVYVGDCTEYNANGECVKSYDGVEESDANNSDVENLEEGNNNGNTD
ncbi:hypothetical protein IJG29_01100 [Candidatus Saccharibacteria bacterium]|nr:hypothetical protein [Candidatus Saccharibacteria bacterium]